MKGMQKLFPPGAATDEGSIQSFVDFLDWMEGRKLRLVLADEQGNIFYLGGTPKGSGNRHAN